MTRRQSQRARKQRSARLRSARTAAALTQAEVAAKVGVKQATISDWETGKTEPSWSHLEKLEALYGTTLRAEPVPA